MKEKNNIYRLYSYMAARRSLHRRMRAELIVASGTPANIKMALLLYMKMSEYFLNWTCIDGGF
jgi:hypothetical protein